MVARSGSSGPPNASAIHPHDPLVDAPVRCFEEEA
jgi:hypothetical protein